MVDCFTNTSNTATDQAGYVTHLCVNGLMTKFKLDTGADVTVITEKTFKTLGIAIRSPGRVLKGADGSVLNVLGETSMNISSRKGADTDAVAFIVGGASANLLGREEIKALGLISIVNTVSEDNILERYESLFQGLGVLPEVFTINVKKNAVPYNTMVPRRVPIGLRDQVQTEL